MAERPSFSLFIGLGVGILAVSNGAILARKALLYAPPITVAAYRLSLAAILLLPLILIYHKTEIAQLGWKRFSIAILSGVFLALHFASWITSLQNTTVASSVVLVATTPLWVAILNSWTLKEKINRALIMGIVLTIIGSIIVGLSDQCDWEYRMFTCPSLANFFTGRAMLGDGLALLGSIMAAGYLLAGRSLCSHISLNAYIFLVYSTAAIILLVWNISAGNQILGYPSPAYGWFLALAVVPQLIGHTSFNWALRYLPTAFVSVALLGEPVGSTILAYFIFNEIPSVVKLIGVGLILMGLLISSLRLQ